MKKRLLSILMSLLLIFTVIPVTAFATEDSPVVMGTEGVDYAPGEAIVCVNGGVSALTGGKGRSVSPDYEIEEIMDVSETSADSKLRSTVENTEKSLILVKSSQDTESLIADLESNPSVEYAEPNYYLVPYDVKEPQDPGYQYQWGLKNQLNNGEETGKTIADIKAVEAWGALGNITDKPPVVAVLDSGVDYNHPDLKEIMWDEGLTTPGLVEMGGGQYGYNPLGGKVPGEETDNPMDKDIGHGTHCAGIIAAQWNTMGGAGVASDVEIMAVRMLSETGGSLVSALKGYAYIQTAAKAGVNVVAINNSWGPSEFTGLQLRSISTAATAIGETNGVVSCFAAGNDNTNNDLNTGGITKSPYVITVGAIESQGHRAGFSSYGMENVDVFAPGAQILSTTSTDPNIPMNKHQMPVQYLPQIGSDDEKNVSYFYENFEGETKKVSLRLLDGEGKKIGDSESLQPGYASNQGIQLDLSQVQEGDNFIIEVVFDRKSLEEASINKELFYLAFQGGFDNAMYAQSLLIQYQKAGGTWENINSTQIRDSGENSPAALRIYDYNWNQSSQELSLLDFMDSGEESNNEVVLRLVPRETMTGKTEAATFRMDDIGFGKTASDYYYADGTSMATPMVTGIVALLASKDEGGARAYDAREVIARVKGGVNRENASDDLIDKSISNGFVNAGAAFNSEQCIPVLNDLEIINGEGILSGYFFGAPGTLEIGGMNIEIEESQWTENKITFAMPMEIEGKQEVVLTPQNKEYGRNFFEITSDTKGYTDLKIPNFDYGTSNGYPLNSKDLYPFTMAAAGNKIAYLGMILENNEFKLSLYDIDKTTWEEVSLPQDILEIRNPSYFSMAGGLTKFYLSYQNKDGKGMIGTYDPEKKTWTSVQGELGGTERLIVYKDQLVAVGGDEMVSEKTSNAVKSIRILDPNTGKTIGSLPDMPQGRSVPYVSASGDRLMVYGGNNGIMKENQSESETYYNTMVFDGNTWKVHEDAFLNPKNPDYDPNQTLSGAISVLNEGAIGVGPVKGLAKPEMMDTWQFDLENGIWSGNENILYSQTKTTRLLSAATNGQFYVLGSKGPEESSLVFRATPVDYTGPTADPNSTNPDPPGPRPDPPTPTPVPPVDDPKPPSPSEDSEISANVKKNQNVGTGLLGNTSRNLLVVGSLLVLLAVGVVVAYKKRRNH